jgi:hypothetical protein
MHHPPVISAFCCQGLRLSYPVQHCKGGGVQHCVTGGVQRARLSLRLRVGVRVCAAGVGVQREDTPAQVPLQEDCG